MSDDKKPEMWPEIKRVFETKRFELTLIGPEISKRIETNNGNLDENLFKLKHINFLEIARTKLSILPPQICNVQNLTSLLCHTNELEAVPAELGKLEHLKNLDLSNNKLTKLPDELKNLKELFTLNLNGNQLQSLFPLGELKKLSVMDIGRNKFKVLPDDLGSSNLENLSQIDASYNELTELSENLSELPALKTFNLENNQLTSVPAALCKCLKLKDLLIKENKLKDNRLKKLVEQDKTKAIFEYLEKAYAEECKNKPKSTSAAKGAGGKSKMGAGIKSFEVEYDLIKVYHFNDKNMTSLELVLDDSVTQVRPFIICAILRGIDLETPGNYKKFLNIQNKIHDETCQKRTLATIATHDLNLIKNKLFYESDSPNNIELVPLGRKNPVNADEYYEKLMEEAEAERKAKKRNQLSGIYNTKNVLIEITSTVSIETCKKVIEELLIEMLNNGIVSVNEISEKVEALSINSEKKEDANSTAEDRVKEELASLGSGKLRNNLFIQQVKVVDSKGALKTVYPSRIDLNFDNSNKIRVLRTYDEPQS